MIGGDVDGFGVTGIAPNANLSSISFVSNSSAQAIRKAADRLGAGDIILLEIHRPGPAATGSGQFGYIAIEGGPTTSPILHATSRGIIVVEAAGNGSQNLDAAVYGTSPPEFQRVQRCSTVPTRSARRDPGRHGAPPAGHGCSRALTARGWTSRTTAQSTCRAGAAR